MDLEANNLFLYEKSSFNFDYWAEFDFGILHDALDHLY